MGTRSGAANTRIAAPASAGSKTRREPEMDTALNVTTLALRQQPDAANTPAMSDGRAPVLGIGGLHYHRHSNGGGLVADTAFVAPTVFVGQNARVEGRALVDGTVRILDNVVVKDQAIVVGRCVLRHEARVSDRATLIGRVVLLNRAHVRGDAWLTGTVVVEHLADIGSNILITGDLRVS